MRFPPPDTARDDLDGLLLLGGEPTVENLLAAYGQGIFPWPVEGWPLPWFCPPRRGILRLARLHVGRSLARAARQSSWRISFDEAFEAVMRHCQAQARPGQEGGTWITEELVRGYTALHRAGYAHSVEVWEGQELVGGLYGVAVRGVFAGESMFHYRPNASKLALLALARHLAARGSSFFDIQQLSPHTAALGAEEVSRDEFLALLRQEQDDERQLFS